ncbi:hypothetical protein LCGC14_0985810 [marine sediment metagenome]|uniref:Uncharacterized protein n=1 Tax=marine sediment metagenome TaxID=412755 RepID=A0A0F9QQM1_9ZZZZ
MAFDKSKIGKYSWNSCLVWAVYHWMRYKGYLIVRWAGKQQQMWYLHFMWLPDLDSKPLHFTKKNIRFPWPIFYGYVKEGDWVETKPAKRQQEK